MKLFIKKVNVDYIGMAASISCAFHCALSMVTLLPLMGLDFLANVWIELYMLAISLIIAVYTIGKTLPKHQSFQPLLLALCRSRWAL